MERKAFIKRIVGILCVVMVLLCGITLVNRRQNIKLQLQKWQENRESYASNRVILEVSNAEEAYRLAKKLGANRDAVRVTSDGTFATVSFADTVDIVDLLSRNTEVLRYAQPDYYVTPAAVAASAPATNFSDDHLSNQTYLDYMNIGNVWNVTTGKGMTVAVIDSGIDIDNPEFAGRISSLSYNASTDEIGIEYVDDEYGHGTAVASVLAAGANNGGMVGVAPDATLLVIKCKTDDKGEFKTSDLVFGLAYAVEQNVDVINMSFGGPGNSNPYARYTELAFDSDILCVASAGNDGVSSISYPAADPYVIGVGAYDYNTGALADFSNYGENVMVVAPGYAVVPKLDGTYNMEKGTSLAAPMVAGALTLYKSLHPRAEFWEIEQMLCASSVDLGTPGKDWFYGYGEIDMDALICGEVGTVTFEMMTEELSNQTHLFVAGHALQCMPEPEREYLIFDDWYYDGGYEDPVEWYEDIFTVDTVLFANWINEDEGIPYRYVTLPDGTIQINGYTGKRRYITIPSIIDGKTVSSVGARAFSGNTRLRTITLPDTLKTIDENAFENCTNITEMVFPDSLERIEANAFQGCGRLSMVDIPINGNLQKIGSKAFASCGSLTQITVPKRLSRFASDAMYGDTALTTLRVSDGNPYYCLKNSALYSKDGSNLVFLPAGLALNYTVSEGTSVIQSDAFAFSRCTSVTLPEGIVTLGPCSFYNSKIESINLPGSIRDLGKVLFGNCQNLSDVSFSETFSLVSTSENMFKGCSSLERIKLPDSITQIAGNTFFCTGLKEITLHEGILSIGKYAFFGTKLTELTLPSSLVTIAQSAFAGNMALQKVSVKESNALLAIEKQAFANCDHLTNFDLREGLSKIGDEAFSGTALRNVTIPASVTNLGCGVFTGTDTLENIYVATDSTTYTSVDGVVYTKDMQILHSYPCGRTGTMEIPASVKTIGSLAFGTSRLSTVLLPDGLERIESNAFAEMPKMQRISLPESVTWIGEFAFRNDTSLVGIVIPGNVTQLGRGAFCNDTNLISVSFGENSVISRIGDSAFSNTAISELEIPASVTQIGMDIVYKCDSLAEISFADGSRLKNLPAYVFNGADKLHTISFGENNHIENIQAHAFSGILNLKHINLEMCTNLRIINNYAFTNCISLEQITLPDSLEEIGRYAFQNCPLTSLTIPESVITIGRYAFSNNGKVNIYFSGSSLPAELQDGWDAGIRGYYVGVQEIVTTAEWVYSVMNNGTVTLLGYMGNAESLNLTTVDGYPVGSIGAKTFQTQHNLRSVILPESLTAIYDYAFAGTENLTEITIPAGVTYLGTGAFEESGVSTVVFSEGTVLKKIGKSAFAGTKNLQRMILPESVKKIEDSAFASSNLTEITFGENASLEQIGKLAFSGTHLQSVEIPDSVTELGYRAFADTRELQQVKLPDTQNLILRSYLFYNSGITEIAIPAGVINIGEFCFSTCENLTSIAVDSENAYYTSVDGVLYNRSCTKLLVYPAGRDGTVEIPATVNTISTGAFEGSLVESVYFEEGSVLNFFGYRTFYDCRNLVEVEIPDTVISIDFYAFANCTSLQRVMIGENSQLTGIYEGAFYKDAALESIHVPALVQTIGEYAFAECSSLTEVTFAEESQLLIIDAYAFANSGITGIEIPDSLSEIGTYAFQNSKLSGNVVIPNSVKFIGRGIFAGADEIEILSVPFLGEYLDDFEKNSLGYLYATEISYSNPGPQKLRSVAITNGEGTETGVFQWSHLQSITIAEGITKASDYAFTSCRSLRELNIPDSLAEVGRDSFNGITPFKGKTLDYPRGLKSYVDMGPCKKLILHENILEITGYPNTEELVVDESNTALKTVDGVLYSKDGKTLIGYPPSRTGTAVVENGTEIIGSSAFSSSKITAVTLPAGLRVVGDYAFVGTSISSIELPQSTEKIGKLAFSGSALTSIFLPQNVQLEETSLYGARNIQRVEVDEQNPHYSVENNLLLDKDKKVLLYIPHAHGGFLIIPASVENCSVPSNEYPTATSIVYESGTEEKNCFSIPVRSTTVTYGIQYIHCDDYVDYGYTTSGRAMLFLGDLQSINERPVNTKTTLYFADERGYETATALVAEEIECVNGAARFYYGDDFTLMLMQDGTASLVEYHGSKTELDIGALYDGDISYIQSYAFSSAVSLTKVMVPSSVKAVGKEAYSAPHYLIVQESEEETGLLIYSEDETELLYVDPTFDGSIQAKSTLYKLSRKQFEDTEFYKNKDNWVDGCLYWGDILIQSGDSVGGSTSIREGTRILASYSIFNCDRAELFYVPDSVEYMGYACFSSNAILWKIQHLSLPFAGSSREDPEYQRLADLLGMADLQTPIFSGSNGISFHEVTIRGGKSVPSKFLNGEYAITKVTIGSEIQRIGSGAFSGTMIKEFVFGGTPLVVESYAFYFREPIPFLNLPKNSIISNSDYVAQNITLSYQDGITVPYDTCGSIEKLFIYNQRTEEIAAKISGTFNQYGCKIYYGDEWNMVAFYDDGQLLTQYPLPAGQVLHTPLVERESDAEGHYNLVGWDADGDGLPDHISATLGADLTATAVFEKEPHEFVDGFCSCGSASDLIEDYGSVYALDWILYKNGLLTISGHGAMNGRPWTESTICEKIKKVIVEDGVTTIADYAFKNCSNLQEVVLPNSITEIGRYAFANCFSLNQIYLPENLDKISHGTFMYCSKLAEINLPDTISEIGEAAFYNCGFMTVELPDSITTIGASAFSYCENLNCIELPDSITTIGASAFRYCKNLNCIELPQGLSKIESNLFASSGLETITIPASIMELESYAFYDCRNLREIDFEGSMPTIASNTFYNVNAVAYYPDGAYDYEAADSYGGNILWFSDANSKVILASGSCGTNVQWELSSDGVLVISGSGKMQDYSFGKNIGDGYAAFVYKIRVEDGVTSVGNYAFAGMKRLTALEYADSMETIGSFAFRETGLKKLVVSGGIKQIKDYGFYGSELEEIEIKKAVTMGSSVFYNLSNLTKVELAEGITGLNSYVFGNCPKLQTITIPSTVTYIRYDAFYQDTSLAEITFLGKPDDINSTAFSTVTADVYYYSDSGWQESDFQNYGGTLTWYAMERNEHNEHTEVTIPGWAATCTEDGMTDGICCKICDEVLKEQEVIPSPGHSWSEPEWTWSEDLTQARAVFTCSVCQTEEELEATVTVNTVEPTETELGKEEYTAMVSFQDVEYTDIREKIMPIPEHSYGDPQWNWSEDGKTCQALFICVDCDDELRIDAEVTIILREVFCSDVGTEIRQAMVILDETSFTNTFTEEVPPQGHHFALWQISICPTEGKTGVLTGCCDVCQHIMEITLPVLSEVDYIYEELEEPTANQSGVGQYTWIEDAYGAIVIPVELPMLQIHTPGDINGDGEVNNKDVTRLFQYLSDWNVEVVEDALDVNGDGEVNNKDLTRLFQYVSDWDVEIH